jgi:hypothetical protein
MTFRRGGLALRLPCFARPILFSFRKGAEPACRRQDTKDLMRFGKDEKKSQPLKVRI